MSVNGRKSSDGVLAAALAAGRTVQRAAEAAGVSERTAHRRLKDPSFKRQVAECRARVLDETLGALTEATTSAVAVMAELLAEGNAPKVRLAAAKAIIDSQLRVSQLVDLERRVLELEERAAAEGGPGHDRTTEVPRYEAGEEAAAALPGVQEPGP
jgi:hypothetical protein